MNKIGEGLYQFNDRKGRRRYMWRGTFFDKQGKRIDERKVLKVGNIDAAVAEARNLNMQVEARKRGEEHPDLTLGEHQEWYIRRITEEEPLLGRVTILQRTGVFVKEIGPDTKVRSVTRQDVKKFVLNLPSRGINAVTVAGYLRAVRRFFNLAIEREVISTNPTAGIKVKQPGRKEPRVLTDQEAIRLIEGFRKRWPRLADLICLLAHTGVRLSEALRLTWDRIHWDREDITFDRTKVDDDHCVRMEKTLFEVMHTRWMIAGMPADNSLVFPSQNGKKLCPHATLRSFKKAATEMGLGWCNLKAFRRYAGTAAAEGTGDIRAASTLLGHKAVSTTQRYLGWGAMAQARATKAVADRLGGESVAESVAVLPSRERIEAVPVKVGAINPESTQLKTLRQLGQLGIEPRTPNLKGWVSSLDGRH
jgi:integrase